MSYDSLASSILDSLAHCSGSLLVLIHVSKFTKLERFTLPPWANRLIAEVLTAGASRLWLWENREQNVRLLQEEGHVQNFQAPRWLGHFFLEKAHKQRQTDLLKRILCVSQFLLFLCLNFIVLLLIFKKPFMVGVQLPSTQHHQPIEQQTGSDGQLHGPMRRRRRDAVLNYILKMTDLSNSVVSITNICSRTCVQTNKTVNTHEYPVILELFEELCTTHKDILYIYIC